LASHPVAAGPRRSVVVRTSIDVARHRSPAASRCVAAASRRHESGRLPIATGPPRSSARPHRHATEWLLVVVVSPRSAAARSRSASTRSPHDVVLPAIAVGRPTPGGAAPQRPASPSHPLRRQTPISPSAFLHLERRFPAGARRQPPARLVLGPPRQPVAGSRSL